MSTCGVRLVLLGKQGAGKGTQASRIAEHYGVEHLSTGELFRAAARAGTPFGVEAQRFMDQGELVPDAIVLGVVEEHFAINDSLRRGFVLDGFPRTRPQAEELERVLDDHPLHVVIDLDVPTEEVLRRIAGRRVCVQCGATYHLDHPPLRPWTCDVCGGHVLQRDDDTEAAVLRRLELYEHETRPLIEFYEQVGRLVRVDGTGESDDVFARCIAAVDEHRALKSL